LGRLRVPPPIIRGSSSSCICSRRFLFTHVDNNFYDFILRPRARKVNFVRRKKFPPHSRSSAGRTSRP
jgi:hypothetical protein